MAKTATFSRTARTRLLEAARRVSARTVNAFMTATYWEIGRRIVEFEQGGKERAEYGETLLLRLSHDLTARRTGQPDGRQAPSAGHPHHRAALLCEQRTTAR